jgi:alkylation response protein AidB-like acyl-CoA dehydrogenase
MDPDASAGKSPTNIKLQGMIMSKRLLSPKTEQASSGISPSSLAAQSLLRTIQELRPVLTARALEIEMSRRIPADVVDVLKRAGIFRMFVPRSYGGLEVDLPAGLEILVELAKIDSSVGWNAMTSSNGSLFAPFLPQQTYEHIYQNGPDVIFAGATQPLGIAEEAGAGERVVNGRWPFASGCQYADWIAGFCVSDSNGKPLLREAGRPQIQAAWLPAHEWQIEETWHAAGLRGTGSHHVVLRNKLVPVSNFSDLERGAPFLSGPLYAALPQFLPLLHAAIALGMAEAAVGNLIDLASSGRRQVQSLVPMRDSEIFQFELGRVVADLRAARALFRAQSASHWDHAVAGTCSGDGLLAESSQAAVWTTTTCVRVADVCFALAGGSAVYENSPLQRRLRDLHVAGQHARLQQRHYVSAGEQLLTRGRETPAAA